MMRTAPFRHLFEVAARAADRPAGADAGDEVGDLPVGVGPDLRAGGLVVAGRSLRVGVLVRLPGAVDLGDQPVRHAVIALRILGRHRRRAHDDLCAVGEQHVALVLADLVGADEDALVAAVLGDQGQADAGVARGGFDDRATRLQLPAGLGGVDHFGRDPVLGAAARVEVFDLCHHGARAVGDDGVQTNQWGAADEVTDVLRDPHTPMVSGIAVRGAAYPVASRM